jgi:hypothetical protein
MSAHPTIDHYDGDREYPVGTVVIFGGEREVTMSNQYSDTRVAGVVAAIADPAHLFPGFNIPVASHGRAPCKVVGKVLKGDLLVTPRIAGVAVVPTSGAIAGTIIGKALQEFSSDHIGTIEIAVGCA